MLKNRSNKLYIGASQDPKQRTKDHSQKLGAKFTKHGRFELVFLEQYENMSFARKREIQIKKWRREKKNNLIKLYQQGIDTRQ